jgi:hypothetical protein
MRKWDRVGKGGRGSKEAGGTVEILTPGRGNLVGVDADIMSLHDFEEELESENVRLYLQGTNTNVTCELGTCIRTS